MNDVVNIDLTRQTLNPYKSEAQVGDKVLIAKKGYVVTNQVYPTSSISVGGKAYLGPSGYISPNSGVLVGTWGAANSVLAPEVGKFLSLPDEDGYCKVYIDL